MKPVPCLTDQAYWTEADQAELELLIWEAIRAGGSREAFALVLEWREYRILRSKAEWLRTRQQAREDLGVAA